MESQDRTVYSCEYPGCQETIALAEPGIERWMFFFRERSVSCPDHVAAYDAYNKALEDWFIAKNKASEEGARLWEEQYVAANPRPVL